MKLRIKLTAFITYLLLLTTLTFAQSFEQSVLATLRADCRNKNLYNIVCTNAIANKDMITLDDIIKKWEKESFHDADLYAMKFQKALLEITKTKIVNSYTKPKDNITYIESWDEERQTGVYSYEIKVYDTSSVSKTAEILEHALLFHPDRLDFYFSLMNLYKAAAFYDKAYSVCLQCFARLDINNNNWLYTMNAPLSHNGDKKKQDSDIMRTITEEYIQPLLKQNTKESINCAQRFSDLISNQYPDNVESYNFLAVSNLLYGSPYKGLKYLEKGLELEPNNLILLENIAIFYGVNGMKKEFYSIINRLKSLGANEKADSLMREYIK